MRTPKAKKYLVNHYRFEETRHNATMFLGPPGIGKSVSVYEAAEIIADEMDRELVIYSDQAGREILESDRDDYFVLNILPLVTHEPMDLTGVPRANGKDLVEFKPLLWAKIMSEYPGILFLDDFLDVQRPDLFSAAYNITLERRAGYQKLHDGVMVVCASNTPEESSLSQMIPAPLANRMVLLNINTPTINEWARWMKKQYGDEWDKRTLAFLKRYSEEGFLLSMPEETEVLNNFPTPRTWTKAALELKAHSDKEVLNGLLGGTVGDKFSAFVETDVDVEELINSPGLWSEQGLDSKYMLCLELSTWMVNNDPIDALGLLDRMKTDSSQYLVLTLLSMNKSDRVKAVNAIYSKRPEYGKTVEQVIEDRTNLKGHIRS